MEFGDRMKESIEKGLEASREFLAKAGGQAQTWGEMGVLRVEILQFRVQLDKVFAALGRDTYAALRLRREPSLGLDSPGVLEGLERAAELEKRIAGLEARFRELGGKDKDLESREPESKD